jgi:NTE family protein/lysophospholipid hydrolase
LVDVLGADAWAEVQRHMSARVYRPGDVVVTQGTLEPDFQVIVSGIASVRASNRQGHAVELTRLGPGDCIGEMALLSGEPASSDIAAITPLETYAIPPAQLATLTEVRGRLVETLSVILASRLRRANDRLVARHQASIYAVSLAGGDVPSLARLPAELANVAGGRVLVLANDEALRQTGFRGEAEREDVSAITLESSDLLDVHGRLALLAHEFDHILVLAQDGALLQLANEVGTHIAIAPEEAAASVSRTTSVVLVSERPWTRATLHELSQTTGAEVVGVIPEAQAGGGANDPVAKLARVLTGRQVGLALGAGGAKGFAHIGVLRALQAMGIPVDVVAGCSIGAAIAAGLAAGLPAEEIASTTSLIASRAIRPALPFRSFLSNTGIRQELARVCGPRRFEELDLPLAIVATDI